MQEIVEGQDTTRVPWLLDTMGKDSPRRVVANLSCCKAFHNLNIILGHSMCLQHPAKHWVYLTALAISLVAHSGIVVINAAVWLPCPNIGVLEVPVPAPIRFHSISLDLLVVRQDVGKMLKVSDFQPMRTEHRHPVWLQPDPRHWFVVPPRWWIQHANYGR